jgi:hypothetical protein
MRRATSFLLTFLILSSVATPSQAQTTPRTPKNTPPSDIPPGFSNSPESRHPPVGRRNPRKDPSARRIRERFNRNNGLPRERFLNRGYFQRELASLQQDLAPRGIKVSMDTYDLLTYAEYAKKYENSDYGSSAEVSPDRMVAVVIYQYVGRINLQTRTFLDPKVTFVRDGISGELIESLIESKPDPEEQSQYLLLPDGSPNPKFKR